MDLGKIFCPTSIAVIGASRDKNSVGHAILTNLKESGYSGDLYVVNPKADKVHGVDSFERVKEIGKKVDLGIVAVPEEAVEEVINDCIEAEVPALVLITAGFSESGDEDAELKIQKLAQEHDIAILGPNCMGVINTEDDYSLNGTFADTTPEKGNISFLSQSGALGIYALKYAAAEKVGFDCFASLGNKAVVDENMLIEYFGERNQTDVIIAYLEDFSDPRRMREVAQKMICEYNKPLIVLKSGRSEKGQKAAASHTGALSSKPEVIDDIFDQLGIIKADSIQHLFNLGRFFRLQKGGKSNRTAILTNAGGPSVLATDRAEKTGLEVVEFSNSTKKEITNGLPDAISAANPIDILGDADVERYKKVLKILMDSDEIDNILIINTPQQTTDLKGLAKMVKEEVIKSDKTVITNFAGFQDMKEVEEVLLEADIPNYHFTSDAVEVLSAGFKFNRQRQKKDSPESFDVDKNKVREVLKYARNKESRYIPAPFSYPVFEAYGMEVTQHKLAKTAMDAAELAYEIGFPVAMNIVSQDIVHKTGTGGVKLNVSTRKEAKSAFDEIIKAIKKEQKDAQIAGVQIQPMIEGGPEMILGVQKSEMYGHLLMFGLGGSLVEALEDVVFKMIPVSRADVQEMIGKIRSRKILEGARGNKPSDKKALENTLLRLSQLVEDFPEIEEIDLNPVYALNDKALLADARIILADSQTVD